MTTLRQLFLKTLSDPHWTLTLTPPFLVWLLSDLPQWPRVAGTGASAGAPRWVLPCSAAQYLLHTTLCQAQAHHHLRQGPRFAVLLTIATEVLLRKAHLFCLPLRQTL